MSCNGSIQCRYTPHWPWLGSLRQFSATGTPPGGGVLRPEGGVTVAGLRGLDAGRGAVDPYSPGGISRYL